MLGDYSRRKCVVGSSSNEEKKKESKEINITIGVFFDGTGNNKYNFRYARDAHKKLEEDDYGSYYGSYTNVAQLWFLYDKSRQYTEKVYVEGPGTEEPIEVRGNNKYKDEDNYVSSGKKDEDLGQGFGAERLGINAKIERACKLIKGKIEKMLHTQNSVIVSTITLDVFGFSRGAASARSFVFRLYGYGATETEGYKVSLKKDHLRGSRFSKTKIIVRFMGLFDTVSSYQYLYTAGEKRFLGKYYSNTSAMRYDRGATASTFVAQAGARIGNKNFDNDVKELGLTIPKDIKHVVHLVAADEYRKYFSLTTVASAHVLGRNCVEYALPGAHSDIGGGYAAEKAEYLYRREGMPLLDSVHDPQDRDFLGYLPFIELYNKKWINKALYDYALQQYENYNKLIKAGRIRDLSFRQKNGYHYERPYRRVRNDYAKIPLDIMYQYAKRSGLSLQNILNSRGAPNALVAKVLTIAPTDSQLRQLIKVSNAIKKKALANQQLYSITPSGLHYVYRGTDIDIMSLRSKFIHLSADHESLWGVNSANPHNVRKIIPG